MSLSFKSNNKIEFSSTNSTRSTKKRGREMDWKYCLSQIFLYDCDSNFVNSFLQLLTDNWVRKKEITFHFRPSEIDEMSNVVLSGKNLVINCQKCQTNFNLSNILSVVSKQVNKYKNDVDFLSKYKTFDIGCKTSSNWVNYLSCTDSQNKSKILKFFTKGWLSSIVLFIQKENSELSVSLMKEYSSNICRKINESGWELCCLSKFSKHDWYPESDSD